MKRGHRWNCPSVNSSCTLCLLNAAEKTCGDGWAVTEEAKAHFPSVNIWVEFWIILFFASFSISGFSSFPSPATLPQPWFYVTVQQSPSEPHLSSSLAALHSLSSFPLSFPTSPLKKVNISQSLLSFSPLLHKSNDTLNNSIAAQPLLPHHLKCMWLIHAPTMDSMLINYLWPVPQKIAKQQSINENDKKYNDILNTLHWYWLDRFASQKISSNQEAPY